MIKDKSKLYAWVIFPIASLVIIVCLYFSYKISDRFLQQFVISLLISILTALIVNFITYLIGRNDYKEAYKELVGNNIPFLYKLKNKGLVDFDKVFPLEKDVYRKDFLESKEVILVMNDGRLFTTNNITLFRQRLKEKNKTTRFIFMNPNLDDSISVWCRKNRHNNNLSYYRDKIAGFLQEIKKYEKDPTHKVDVLYHDYFTTMGILLTDSYAMISLYRISPGKDAVPHLIFKKNDEEECEFCRIKDDVQKIISAVTQREL